MGLLDLFKAGKREDQVIVDDVNQIFEKEARDYTRGIIDRIIYRNILFYIGEHWVEFVRHAGTFRKRQVPNAVPTPVSNDIRDAVRSGKALLLNQKLVPRIWPNSNDREDKKAAEMGQDLLSWMDSTNDEEFMEEKEKTAIWIYLAGTGFMRSYIDVEAGKWFMTKDGLIQTGDVITRSIPPFNVVVDYQGETLRDKRYAGIQTLVPKEWVEDNFKVTLSGRGSSPGAVDYQRKLMKLVAQVSPWKGVGLDAVLSDEADQDLVLFREVEFRPTKSFPNGRYMAVCEDKMLLNVAKMPIPVKDGKWFYTLTDFHFDYVPGRFWSDPGVNDLISPQVAINEIDQALAVNRRGIGRPKIFLAGDFKLEKVNEPGSPLLIIRYDPIANAGKTPEMQQGIPLPPQVFQERQAHKAQIQDSSGDPKNILRGQAPGSGASGIQVDILRETAEKGHYPDMDRYNRAMSRVYKKRLILAQECIKEPRMIKIAGKGSEIKVKSFIGSDLRNNTDVRLELDSGTAQTKTGQRQLLLDLAKQGLFGPIDADPELRQELLLRFGLSGFSEQNNIDRERAENENCEIAAGRPEGIMLLDDAPQEVIDPMTGQPAVDPMTGQPLPPEVPEDPMMRPVLQHDEAFKYDNHKIHYEVHRRFILAEEFNALDPKAQKILMSHTDVHNALVRQEMQAQAMAAMPQAPGGPGGPGGGPPGGPTAPVGPPGGGAGPGEQQVE